MMPSEVAPGCLHGTKKSQSPWVCPRFALLTATNHAHQNSNACRVFVYVLTPGHSSTKPLSRETKPPDGSFSSSVRGSLLVKSLSARVAGWLKVLERSSRTMSHDKHFSVRSREKMSYGSPAHLSGRSPERMFYMRCW